MTCCAIATRPDAEAIAEALRSGAGVRPLAVRFGLTKSALGRHRGHLGLDATEPGTPIGTVAEVPGTPEPETSKPTVPTPSDDARARSLVDPDEVLDITADSYQERVLTIADIMNRGQYLGHATAKKLAADWGVSRGAVQNYARAAAVVCAADRGQLDQVREVSVGTWTRLRLQAEEDGDAKAANTAQAGLDRASGLVVGSPAPITVISVTLANGQALEIPKTELMAGVYRGANLLPEEMRALFWSGFGGEENGIVVREKV